MRPRLHLLAVGAIGLFFIFMLGGCCAFNTVKPLKEAKALAAQQDYAALAAVEVKCQASCEGCNQLHLLKGDACYRLAKAGKAPEPNYRCAAAELTDGIRLTRNWQMDSFDLNQAQTYTNLCEALRNHRDLLSGSQADGVNAQLLASAQAFLAAQPGNPCARYFENNARYAQLRTCLLHPENCPDLCARLQAMRQSLDQAAGGECAAQLSNLKKDIAGAEQVARCR
jgi:uncharacterized protein (DUF2267 family)